MRLLEHQRFFPADSSATDSSDRAPHPRLRGHAWSRDCSLESLPTRARAWRWIRSAVAAAAVLVVVSNANALTFEATFINAAGQTWTDERKALVRYVLAEYEAQIADDQTVLVQFTFHDPDELFTHAMAWSAGEVSDDSIPIRPWTPRIRHGILLSKDLAANGFWDATPETDDDVPPDNYDILTILRHEMAHAMGHMVGHGRSFDADGEPYDPWLALIDDEGVFDPGGMNVQMYPGGYGHIDEDGLMNPMILVGERYPIDHTVKMLALAYGYTLREADAPPDEPEAADLPAAGRLLPLMAAACWRLAPTVIADSVLT